MVYVRAWVQAPVPRKKEKEGRRENKRGRGRRKGGIGRIIRVTGT